MAPTTVQTTADSASATVFDIDSTNSAPEPSSPFSCAIISSVRRKAGIALLTLSTLKPAEALW